MPVSRTSHLSAAQTQVWVGSVLFGHAEDDAPRQPKHDYAGTEAKGPSLFFFKSTFYIL